MILGFLGFLQFSWLDILDIALVAAIIFALFRWIRGTSALNIFIAIIILLVVRVISVAAGLKMMSALMGTILDMGAVAIIVIFQPEIRRFLGKIGRTAGNTLDKRNFIERLMHGKSSGSISPESAGEIIQACDEMSAQKTGALIVIRHSDRLEDIISSGDTVDARICSRLIMNIFFKNSPLHDGAMVIGQDRIMAARCTLPISDNPSLPASFGMRHKAAVGLSEQCDADVLVVSEQTGDISFVHGGKVTHVSERNQLALLLRTGTDKETAEEKQA